MAENIPEGVPATLTAGNTWQWTQRLSDYAPTETGGTWALSYAIAGIGALPWDASWVTDDGAVWTVAIPATSTANLPAGRYEWLAIVTGGGGYAGRRHTPVAGTLLVAANPEQWQQGDRQPWVEKTLAVIEEVLAGRITGDVQAYQIGTRSVTSIPILELYALRTRLQHELQRLRKGTDPVRRIRFGTA